MQQRVGLETPAAGHRVRAWLLALGIGCTLLGCAKKGSEMQFASDIEGRRAQFMRQELHANLEHLTVGDRSAVDHLISAARIMDDIFWRQAWAGSPDFAKHVTDLSGPGGRAAQDYYRIMFGPWDRLRSRQPFIGNLPHPPGAGFYPEDMTKEEFEAWITAHPEDKASFESPTTVIRREGTRLVAVPYSSEYGDLLRRAASSLRTAAQVASTPSLKTFLESRAAAFLSDDYLQSDMDWMDLDGNLEIVIGPYETYEDELFGYKASFEALLCVVDPLDSENLGKFKAELPWLEANLPIPDKHKNPNRGAESPIRVVDEIYTAGDARAGVPTIAFNLPNDERVRETKGSKKVLLKNMMRAKYDAILVPIAERAIPSDRMSDVDFDTYYHFVLFHELCHGLGPGRIVVDGRETEVRLELKDLYATLEEAKADVMGAWALHLLADKGLMEASIASQLPWTFVPGLLRSARFGITEAHALGVICQFTYLMEKGALVQTPEGRLAPVPALWFQSITELTHDLTMLQALGDYDTAKAWVDKYGQVPAGMQKILDSLADIPVDVDPIYTAVPQQLSQRR
jgi:hypothetical protein